MRLLLQSLLRNFKIIEKDGGTAYLCEYKDTLYDKEFNQMNYQKRLPRCIKRKMITLLWLNGLLKNSHETDAM